MDYFRSIQIPKNVPESIRITDDIPRHNNQYTNPTFVASSNDLTFPDRSHKHLQNPKQPQIWSTSNAHFPDIPQVNFKQKHINKNKQQKKAFLSTNKRCVLITIISFIIAVIICITIALALIYNYYWKPKSLLLTECVQKCHSNKYCVSGLTADFNSTCVCKPGYSWNIHTNECEQNVCYSGYVPYTYLNSYSPQNPKPYNTRFLKPYCCPNSNYLTSACCGKSHLSKF